VRMRMRMRMLTGDGDLAGRVYPRLVVVGGLVKILLLPLAPVTGELSAPSLTCATVWRGPVGICKPGGDCVGKLTACSDELISSGWAGSTGPAGRQPNS